MSENITETPQEIVIRSLRRRLWRALQQEDADAARRIYSATRADWETWVHDERELERKREEERQSQQRPLFKKLTHRKSHSKRRATLLRNPHSPAVQAPRNNKQGTVGLLQLCWNPVESFHADDFRDPSDPYLDPEPAASPKPPTPRKNSYRKRRSARHSFSLWGRAPKEEPEEEEEEMESIDPNLDPRMTTPLHEAARLGHGELVRMMLDKKQLDITARNGSGRTVLHMVAGGVNREEATRVDTRDEESLVIGIRAPQPVVPEPTAEAGHSHTALSAKAVRVMGRMFRDSLRKSDEEDPVQEASEVAPMSDDRWDELQMERTDAALAILSWIHPDDGSELSGQGCSTNSVDSIGRAALHYAAELGRAEICFAVLSSFGSMLTIVDDGSKTPCELAEEGGHEELAAQLEARAVLYVDPYGMNDELLASIMSNNNREANRNRLVPPFSWYETLTLDKAQAERERRLEQTQQKINEAVQAVQAAVGDSAGESSDDERKSRAVDAEAPATKESSPDETATTEEQTPAESEEETSTSASDVGLTTSDSGRVGASMLLDPPSGEFSSNAETQIFFDALSKPKNGAKDLSVFVDLEKSYVEQFLAHHRWDVKSALTAFLEDPFAAFEESSVPLPGQTASVTNDCETSATPACLICFEEFDEGSSDWRKLSLCEHSFCSDCLGEYIASCAQAKSTGLCIACPHHECESLLTPFEVVELCCTPEDYDVLLQTANENFVAKARDFRFCPYPGCRGIVQFNAPPYFAKTPGLDPDLLDIVGAVCTGPPRDQATSCPRTYEGVYDLHYTDSKSREPPRRAHRFCFACGEAGFHWPVSCERLEEWKTTVQEQVKEVQGGNGDDNYNDVAQKLWLKTNTRPCPKCKAPIEKHEGCNHMTCSNPLCKYEFCWICRNDWKLHGTETGGFFRCNRWIDQKEHDFYDVKPDEPATAAARGEDVSDPSTMSATYGTAMHASRVASKRSREMGRFLHHYQRWNAHAESAILERKMSETVGTRLAPVVRAAAEYSGRSNFNFDDDGLSFVHDAFAELLECRSMLQHSYAFSNFRYKISEVKNFRHVKRRLNEKHSFEQLQSELEMMTEQMSDVVARSHLRASQSQIKFLTTVASEKRKEFSNVMIGIHMLERKEAQQELAGAAEAKPKEPSGRNRAIPEGFLDSLGAATATAATRNTNQTINDNANATEDATASTLADADMEEAIQASLAEYAVSRSPRSAAEEALDEVIGDWACSACTYVNAEGRRCAMCGTARE